MNDQSTTDRLGEELRSVRDDDGLNDYLKKEGTVSPYSSFIEYFTSLDKTKNLTAADLFEKANLDRRYLYHIWDGTKKPGKDKIISLCIAAKLDLTETKKALEAGSHPPLYPRNTRDAVLIYAINNGFDVSRTNELLCEMGLEVLNKSKGDDY